MYRNDRPDHDFQSLFAACHLLRGQDDLIHYQSSLPPQACSPPQRQALSQPAQLPSQPQYMSAEPLHMTRHNQSSHPVSPNFQALSFLTPGNHVSWSDIGMTHTQAHEGLCGSLAQALQGIQLAPLLLPLQHLLDSAHHLHGASLRSTCRPVMPW